jgi:hypothetical protein
VIDMMIAGFLDKDAVSFEGCKPLRGMNFQKASSVYLSTNQSGE